MGLRMPVSHTKSLATQRRCDHTANGAQDLRSDMVALVRVPVRMRGLGRLCLGMSMAQVDVTRPGGILGLLESRRYRVSDEGSRCDVSTGVSALNTE